MHVIGRDEYMAYLRDHGPLFHDVRLEEAHVDNGGGSRIVTLEKDSLAWRTGLRRGDVLLAVDGVPVGLDPGYAGPIFARTPPREVYTIRRGTRTVNLALEVR